MPVTDAPVPTYDVDRPVPTRDAHEPPLRVLLGAVLRAHRERQGRTLRDVAGTAQVSLPYLSEVERGRKEPSSEVLAAVCRALGLRLVDLVADAYRLLDRSRPVTGSAEGGRLVDLTSAPVVDLAAHRRSSATLAPSAVSRTVPGATRVPDAGLVSLAA